MHLRGRETLLFPSLGHASIPGPTFEAGRENWGEQLIRCFLLVLLTLSKLQSRIVSLLGKPKPGSRDTRLVYCTSDAPCVLEIFSTGDRTNWTEYLPSFWTGARWTLSNLVLLELCGILSASSSKFLMPLSLEDVNFDHLSWGFSDGGSGSPFFSLVS